MVVGRGLAQIKLDDGVAQTVRRALERLAPGTLRRIEREANEIADEAYNRWPVDSGRSREALRVVTILNRRSIDVTIQDPVDYVKFIKFRRKLSGDGGKPVWQTLVARPAKERTPKLVEDLQAELVALARGH